MGNQLKFLDESGDKKYFTIIPNYIVNHSTAIDQSLYLQMKRIAGEGETCEAGYRYFIKQMDIGYKAYKKSINYLISNNWITYLGKKRVQTEGGVQSISSYRVNDIWQLNNEYYQGGAESKPLMPQGGAESKVKVVLEGDQGGAESKHKKNRLRTKEEEGSKTDVLQTNELIESFKSLNPLTYMKWFANKTQRAAVERLYKQLGREKLMVAIEAAQKAQTIKYAPMITTPLQLEDKLAELRAFTIKEKNTKKWHII